ncbi:nucleoside phosphorylase domain-containing protein [Aspergillus cavernicola]|uniref:Nucleoside phosphorylase domain-containing protein n=1 Tax=Aspergillus cavernicola TaxID=176166 RepID=A0ABR4IXH8_9EURO
MMDEEHGTLAQSPTDDNIYTLGRMGEHNVVIAHLPSGRMGTTTAAAVAAGMKARFRALQFVLLVGIGGGAPSDEADIRLGDVVVSQPTATHGGVIQYDHGKRTPRGFQRTASLNQPPRLLLTALAKVQANQFSGRGLLSHLLFSTFGANPYFSRGHAGPDQLFLPGYCHVRGATCTACDPSQIVKRAPRYPEASIVAHYGTIASGNQVMRDGVARDLISSELDGVLCFEMEAAGLMNEFPCLVIRGICDYADSHKNKAWQPFAAAVAAAQAKEILAAIPGHEAAAPLAGGQRADRLGLAGLGPMGKEQEHGGFSPVIFSGTNHGGFQMGVNYGTINGI